MLLNTIAALRSHFGRDNPAAHQNVDDEGPARARTSPASATADVSPKSIASNAATNPYIDARREWNERYGDYIQQAHHWRTVAIISGMTTLIAVIGLGFIGAQNKVVPYVVEVDKLGAVAAVERADAASSVDPRIVKAYLARFVADWRTVSIDRQAQKNAIDRVYAMLPSGSVALSKVNEHFRSNNPFALASKRTVSVAVTNLLPISDQTWQVEWREVTRDARGDVQGDLRMKASIIVGITPSTDERLILINPLGVYVTDLNWSQQI